MPGRLKDLADVQEPIRALGPGRDFSAPLHEYVRPKYDELWRATPESPHDD